MTGRRGLAELVLGMWSQRLPGKPLGPAPQPAAEIKVGWVWTGDTDPLWGSVGPFGLETGPPLSMHSSSMSLVPDPFPPP